MGSYAGDPSCPLTLAIGCEGWKEETRFGGDEIQVEEV
jgi:hypothetical protein